jgi:hypothetical protein
MIFAIKAEVGDPRAETFELGAQKTMYGGKHIAQGDTIYRQATNKIVGISDEAAAFLRGFF